MEMERAEGYRGPHRGNEGYERLRGIPGIYEEILEDPEDGYLHPPIPGDETTTKTDTDGYLLPLRQSEIYA